MNWRQVETDLGCILINMDNVETIEPIARDKENVEYHMTSGEVHIVKGNFKHTAAALMTKEQHIFIQDQVEENPHYFSDAAHAIPKSVYMDGRPR